MERNLGTRSYEALRRRSQESGVCNPATCGNRMAWKAIGLLPRLHPLTFEREARTDDRATTHVLAARRSNILRLDFVVEGVSTHALNLLVHPFGLHAVASLYARVAKSENLDTTGLT